MNRTSQPGSAKPSAATLTTCGPWPAATSASMNTVSSSACSSIAGLSRKTRSKSRRTSAGGGPSKVATTCRGDPGRSAAFASTRTMAVTSACASASFSIRRYPIRPVAPVTSITLLLPVRRCLPYSGPERRGARYSAGRRQPGRYAVEQAVEAELEALVPGLRRVRIDPGLDHALDVRIAVRVCEPLVEAFPLSVDLFRSHDRLPLRPYAFRAHLLDLAQHRAQDVGDHGHQDVHHHPGIHAGPGDHAEHEIQVPRVIRAARRPVGGVLHDPRVPQQARAVAVGQLPEISLPVPGRLGHADLGFE